MHAAVVMEELRVRYVVMKQMFSQFALDPLSLMTLLAHSKFC